MESIMQFIYLGEATFYEERMEEFLAVAKSLEIKELCNAGPKPNDETDDEPEDEPIPTEHIIASETYEEQTVIYDQIINQTTDIRRGEVKHINDKFECLKCQKTYFDRSTLNRHNRSVHEGVKYACNQCDYQATTQTNLTRHIQSKHECVKYRE